MHLTVHRANNCRRVFGGEQRGSAQRGLDVRYNQRCGKAFAGRIGDGEPNAAARQGYELEAITSQRAHLPAADMVSEPLCFSARDCHESFLQAAGRHPVLADVHYYGFANHLSCASIDRSTQEGLKSTSNRQLFCPKTLPEHVEN